MASPRWKDALSLTSAYYAGATAYSIGQKFPEVEEAIREWNQTDTTMLESPLTRNQELTNIILQETPWALEANNERKHRQQLATLFHDVTQEHYRMTMLNAQKNLYYQVNATYYSALGESDEKMLLARAIQMFMPGKPQIWYLDLFAGKNDHEAVQRAGESGHKEINRTNLSGDQIAEGLKKDVVQKRLAD